MAGIWGQVVGGLATRVPFFILARSYRRGLTDAPDDAIEREPPSDLTPAVVGTLFGARRLATDSVATMLDLARRHVISIERVPLPGPEATPAHDHRLTLDPSRAAGLDLVETLLVDFLFGQGAARRPEVTISQARRRFARSSGDLRSMELLWERAATALARGRLTSDRQAAVPRGAAARMKSRRRQSAAPVGHPSRTPLPPEAPRTHDRA